MAVLSAGDRAEISAEYQREISMVRESLGLTKADLLAAVNALDDFFNANATAVNNAIPQPARGALTSAQKARLLVFVIRQRYIKGA